MVDVEKALVDPALVFKTPEEVLADKRAFAGAKDKDFAAVGIRREGVASR